MPLDALTDDETLDPYSQRIAAAVDRVGPAVVHVAVSSAARRRRVPAELAARELAAYDRYDVEVRPAEAADVVVRADDPRRPAVIVRPG